MIDDEHEPSVDGPPAAGEGADGDGAAGEGGVARGAGVIARHLRTLPGSPGVYRMIAEDGAVLYVGKAKDLKKRVAAYTHPDRQTYRIRRMIALTTDMEFVTTATEAEALLLESNLIKRYAPRYNILLRDDKSFPYILVTGDHDYPQVVKYRGAKSRKGDYFGPFASVWAVNDALNILQKAFLLRSCSDHVFSGRIRPCLLYQIKRCSAPCVGRIGQDGYREQVDQARAFLTGDSQAVQQQFSARMQAASDALEFEQAAQYRDRIQALTRIQAHQDINMRSVGDADVIAAHRKGGHTCVQVFFFRSGANYGNRAYFPSHGADDAVEDVLEAFIGQFYARALPPNTVIVSDKLPNRALVAEALSVRAERKVAVEVPSRGERKKVVDHAVANAREALSRRLSEGATQRKLLDGLAEVLGLEAPLERIEVYDNSHVGGTEAVGGMIVAGPDGFMKNAYRKFNIRNARSANDGGGHIKGGGAASGGKTGGGKTGGGKTGGTAEYQSGDDYAMMREVLTRRFSRAQKEDPDRAQGQWPDLVLIDGGKGQLGVALEVFADLGIDDVALAAIAKGPDRNAGRERIFMDGRDAILLKPQDPVLYFLQRLRDEAHRFAIGAHRNRRAKAIQTSKLDEVPGIGAHRKRALLHHFGHAKAVEEARPEDLRAVGGISKSMAQKIYDWFHPED
ncbi:MAG: excinuclease ABC subunit UvrC [Rhodospirillaceae bacterium]